MTTPQPGLFPASDTASDATECRGTVLLVEDDAVLRMLLRNGLENAGLMLGINGGRHVNPYFAGGTIFAWSEVLEKADLGGAGALRLRLVATKDRPCGDFPDKDAEGAYPGEVILDFDYWAAVPKRG